MPLVITQQSMTLGFALRRAFQADLSRLSGGDRDGAVEKHNPAAGRPPVLQAWRVRPVCERRALLRLLTVGRNSRRRWVCLGRTALALQANACSSVA
jgi:hypothetical protein